MKKGFTLIELLVVIAILAVLATAVVLAINPAELGRAHSAGAGFHENLGFGGNKQRHRSLFVGHYFSRLGWSEWCFLH
ncbi:MAG: hypothetical protein UY55_C0003G0069 [Candidatus Jorgensenbacteria bacterium GW2011_GWB1_50_10]|uniref:Uncharacterized protein n=1 Tax=Candidatus Jorgensenbacteria bacterium GW2011_GWB1_50_10 TaxID=1618665 RepID=A0A0G1YIM9_9BACT|nr:MAG: hypothetical protein UY55_C0003G0069 [Candidatus Jorgensenbacteria bacterium GW2011_GWB1_50_10]